MSTAVMFRQCPAAAAEGGLASLLEGGGTALAVTEGVSYRKSHTPPVSLALDSPLWEGAKIAPAAAGGGIPSPGEG